MRREFLQLAHKLNPAKHQIGGYLMSEKLDGTRCFWDGGISRGQRTRFVPWANITDPKTGKLKRKIKPVATGLWSRYGNPIIAPDWFLNALPACCLDGELWAGRGNFQLCRSICGGDQPDERFNQIKYAVYSAPSFQALFQTGEIKNTNMHCQLFFDKCIQYITSRLKDFEGDFSISTSENFRQEVDFLSKVFESQHKFCFPLHQEELPLDLGEAHLQVAKRLDAVLQLGGEGVVLRDPDAAWLPKRNHGILKWKPYSDAEGTIIGFTSGRETNKGSRLLGKIGSLIVDYDGKRLELAGLTDAEREFKDNDMSIYAAQNPGIDMPLTFQGKYFTTGHMVTFKYRELTDNKIPKEARYFRKRDIE